MSLPKTAAGVSSAPSGLVGKTIAGRFEIEVQLGAGGMGEVYRATDTRLKRKVALKRVAPGLLVEARYTERLQSEAELASVLNSPNISAIHDVFQSDGEVFLVMEFVEGMNLRQRLLQPLPLDEFLGIAVQCASALAAAQARGIVHGDIKPENIMLTPSGQAKVLDFGIARRMPEEGTTLDALAASRWLCGTPAYLAPEVLLAKQSDTRADIFALGVVFYESLSGRHPFQADSFLAVANRILQETPAPLMATNPKLPAELDRIVSKMLAKDPADRYATAADLGVDLRGLQKASPLAFRQSAVLPQPAAAEPAARKAPAALRGLKWPLAAVLGITLLAAVFELTRLGRAPTSIAPPSAISSIAVLPLKNISGDPKQEYFADGLTDALTSELAGISSLRVISRTSAMLYKAANKSVPQIARELKVDAVIEGSVERSGERVIVRASLIQASPERTLWTRPYESSLSDILSLENQVARSVAEGINLNLTERERQRLSRQRKQVNPAAYDAYLAGRHAWEERTSEGLKKSVQYFNRAIQMDPAYAQAYAGLADAYATLGNNRFLPPDEAFPAAKSAAQKAIELDDSLADAHASLAFAVWNYDFDWNLVEREYKRAIDLNPSYANAYHWYSGYLSGMGRNADAIAAIKRARELDPLSPRISANVGLILYFARDYDQAIEELRKAAQKDPASGAPDLYLGMAYLQKGDYPEAIRSLNRNLHVPHDSTASASLELAYGDAVAGQPNLARETLRLYTQQVKGRYVPALWIARVYVALGEKDNAFAWLEKAYEERSPQLPFLNVDPRLDSIREDPRFQDILRRMKLRS